MNAKYPPEVKEGQKVEDQLGVITCCGISMFFGNTEWGESQVWHWQPNEKFWYDATYRAPTLADLDRRLIKLEHLFNSMHPHSDSQNTPESPASSQDSDQSTAKDHH